MFNPDSTLQGEIDKIENKEITGEVLYLDKGIIIYDQNWYENIIKDIIVISKETEMVNCFKEALEIFLKSNKEIYIYYKNSFPLIKEYESVILKLGGEVNYFKDLVALEIN